MQANVLTVVRQGKRWGVSADGAVLALARTKREATELAKSAAQILRDSGGAAEVRVAPEPRSFAKD